MDTKDTITNVLAAYASGDADTILSLVDDAVRFRVVAADGTDCWSIECDCKDGLMDALKRINSDITISSYDVIEILTQGDRAATRQQLAFHGKDGVRHTSQVAGLWTVRDGKVVELIEFEDTAVVGLARSAVAN